MGMLILLPHSVDSPSSEKAKQLVNGHLGQLYQLKQLFSNLASGA
jgi:hypothetical protein